MSTLCIVSRDKMFARMLELELGTLCNTVKTVTERLNPPALKLAISKASLVIFDGEYYNGDLTFIEKNDFKYIVFSNKVITDLPKSIAVYFERPFSVAELKKETARLAGIKNGEAPTPQKTFDVDSIELDIFSKQARINGNIIKFSPREFSLLLLLYKNRGRIVMRKEVIETVWGSDYDMKNNADNVYINYLRKKLDDFLGVKLIYTVRGKGYMMK